MTAVVQMRPGKPSEFPLYVLAVRMPSDVRGVLRGQDTDDQEILSRKSLVLRD